MKKLSIACSAFATLLFIIFSAISFPPPSHAEIFSTKIYRINVITVASGLAHPWSIAFLPDGSMLVTERAGKIQWIKADGKKTPVENMPEVVSGGQGGLMDIQLDNKFNLNKQIYFSYSEPRRDGTTGTSIGKARFVPGITPRLENVHVIFRQNNPTRSRNHFGSRLVMAPDNKLFFSIGDRQQSKRAQDPFDHAGSMLRINTDGSIPDSNPFAEGKRGAREIWSIGHRNPQGAALNRQTSRIWTVEHGAAGGDEINLPEPGRNYGWPVIAYGTHYSGEQIGIGTHHPEMEQPKWFWNPSIAPSGLTFYDGDKFPDWQGSLFVGALKGAMLSRLTLEGEKIISEERFIKNKFGRIRDVRQGPDGNLYLLTDSRDGKILQISRAFP